MAFELSWLLQGRVLYARVFGTVTDRDDAIYDETVQAFLDQSNGLPVHIVTDYTGLETIQTEITPTLPEPPLRPLSKHPALGCRVAVGSESSLSRYLAACCSFGLKPCQSTFTALDSALAHLCHIDRTLPREWVLIEEAPCPKPA